MRPAPKFPLKSKFRIDDKDAVVVGHEWGPDSSTNRSDGWLYWVIGLTPDGQAKAIPEAKIQKYLTVEFAQNFR